jgi:fumarate reductase subunit D
LRFSAHDPEKWEPVFGKDHAQMEKVMMRASHKQPGFIAALLHRLSGIALAVFLPLHFLALAAALKGAGALDSFLALTRQPLIQFLEFGIVVALAVHLTLGLRVLAIEFFDIREKTAAALSACVAAVLGVGLVFLFSLV